jgi:hypothetical protein
MKNLHTLAKVASVIQKFDMGNPFDALFSLQKFTHDHSKNMFINYQYTFNLAFLDIVTSIMHAYCKFNKISFKNYKNKFLKPTIYRNAHPLIKSRPKDILDNMNELIGLINSQASLIGLNKICIKIISSALTNHVSTIEKMFKRQKQIVHFSTECLIHRTFSKDEYDRSYLTQKQIPRLSARALILQQL